MDRPVYKVIGDLGDAFGGGVKIIDPNGEDIAKYVEGYKIEHVVGSLCKLTLTLFADVDIDIHAPHVEISKGEAKKDD